MAEFITIKIPCKPYVRKYLTNHFGNPADLKSNKCFSYFFRRVLDRNLRRNEKDISLSIYSSEIDICLTEDEFQRFGHFLNKTDISHLNKFFEQYIKEQARLVLSVHLGYNDNLTYCIQEFQKQFGFTEDDFPTDSIKKDFTRNADFYGKFFGKIVPAFGISVLKNKDL
jgi:hypothetical protein